MAERIILISAKGHDLNVVGKLKRHAEGLTGEIVGGHPNMAFFNRNYVLASQNINSLFVEPLAQTQLGKMW